MTNIHLVLKTIQESHDGRLVHYLTCQNEKRQLKYPFQYISH